MKRLRSEGHNYDLMVNMLLYKIMNIIRLVYVLYHYVIDYRDD